MSFAEKTLNTNNFRTRPFAKRAQMDGNSVLPVNAVSNAPTTAVSLNPQHCISTPFVARLSSWSTSGPPSSKLPWLRATSASRLQKSNRNDNTHQFRVQERGPHEPVGPNIKAVGDVFAQGNLYLSSALLQSKVGPHSLSQSQIRFGQPSDGLSKVNQSFRHSRIARRSKPWSEGRPQRDAMQ